MTLTAAVRTVSLLLIGLSSCSPDSASRLTQVPEDVADTLTELETGTRSTVEETAALRSQVQAGNHERERLIAEKSGRELEVRQLQEDIKTLQAEFTTYRAEYRRAIQTRAAGMSLPGLTADGKSYGDVVVSSVTDTHLAVLTDSGLTRMPLASTPPAIQALFAYEPGLKTVPPPLLAAPDAGMGYLDRVIADGKRTAADNKRQILEMKAAREKKKNPPKYLRAPQPANSFQSRMRTSFEGSFYAPYSSRR